MGAPRTLAIDIGGSGIKALLLDAKGHPISERVRVKTPRPATPAAMLRATAELIADLPRYDRVSVGFPGVLMEGVVRSATNLHPRWIGVNATRRFREITGKPCRVANDADVQGLGVVRGRGVELVLTLGTGVGSALFLDGVLVPNLELGHHPFRKSETYEEQLGEQALQRIGKRRWTRRLRLAIRALDKAFNCRRLYLGGGNSRLVSMALPRNVTRVSNLAGLLGGIRLWDKAPEDRR